MTLVGTRPADGRTAGPPGGADGGPDSTGGGHDGGDPWALMSLRKPPRLLSTQVRVVSTAIMILSAVLLSFALYVGAISGLHYDRAQRQAYANFRTDLANAVAPTGQTQPGHPDKLLPLGTAVAVLDIPSLKLKTVVFEGTTGAVLENGPGHLRDTPLPGQAGTSEILGRAAAYGGPFQGLDHLAPGEILTVITGQGTQKYQVLDVRRTGDPLPPALAAGAGRLILVTADGAPFAPSGVLRVDADLVSPIVSSVPLVLGAAQLPAAERAMATDSAAWYVLVLWGQALLLAAGLITWARTHWGGWQTWIVAVPVLGFFSLAVADQITRLLPNLM